MFTTPAKILVLHKHVYKASFKLCNVDLNKSYICIWKVTTRRTTYNDKVDATRKIQGVIMGHKEANETRFIAYWPFSCGKQHPKQFVTWVPLPTWSEPYSFSVCLQYLTQSSCLQQNCTINTCDGKSYNTNPFIYDSHDTHTTLTLYLSRKLSPGR